MLEKTTMTASKPTTLGIGDRIRDMRRAKSMSQGDIEERSGLLRCYISRVENGHTVPSIETLERFASALDVPVFSFFKPRHDSAENGSATEEACRNNSEQDLETCESFVRQLREILPRLSRKDQRVLIALAQKMAEE